MTVQAPLVRTEHGAILGVDWRRERGLVPGQIEAKNVVTGDTLVAQGTRVVVFRTGRHNDNAVIQARSAGGAEVVIVRPLEQLVRVVAVGAFDQ